MQIEFHQADLRYAARVALKPLTLSLNEARIGVIGLNGIFGGRLLGGGPDASRRDRGG